MKQFVFTRSFPGLSSKFVIDRIMEWSKGEISKGRIEGRTRIVMSHGSYLEFISYYSRNAKKNFIFNVEESDGNASVKVDVRPGLLYPSRSSLDDEKANLFLNALLCEIWDFIEFKNFEAYKERALVRQEELNDGLNKLRRNVPKNLTILGIGLSLFIVAMFLPMPRFIAILLLVPVLLSFLIGSIGLAGLIGFMVYRREARVVRRRLQSLAATLDSC
jgi:hypothetical protein